MIEPFQMVSTNMVFITKEAGLSTYVFVTFKFPGCYPCSLDILIDAGAYTNHARPNASTDEWWTPLTDPITLRIAGGNGI